MPTVYVTAPADAAEDLVQSLLEERLVACVNRLPCRSTYRWEGEVHHDEEEILLAKTTEAAVDDLIARIEALHPYDVPCIERFDETAVLESFAAWRGDVVSPVE